MEEDASEIPFPTSSMKNTAGSTAKRFPQVSDEEEDNEFSEYDFEDSENDNSQTGEINENRTSLESQQISAVTDLSLSSNEEGDYEESALESNVDSEESAVTSFVETEDIEIESMLENFLSNNEWNASDEPEHEDEDQEDEDGQEGDNEDEDGQEDETDEEKEVENENDAHFGTQIQRNSIEEEQGRKSYDGEINLFAKEDKIDKYLELCKRLSYEKRKLGFLENRIRLSLDRKAKVARQMNKNAQNILLRKEREAAALQAAQTGGVTVTTVQRTNVVSNSVNNMNPVGPVPSLTFINPATVHNELSSANDMLLMQSSTISILLDTSKSLRKGPQQGQNGKPNKKRKHKNEHHYLPQIYSALEKTGHVPLKSHSSTDCFFHDPDDFSKSTKQLFRKLLKIYADRMKQMIIFEKNHQKKLHNLETELNVWILFESRLFRFFMRMVTFFSKSSPSNNSNAYLGKCHCHTNVKDDPKSLQSFLTQFTNIYQEFRRASYGKHYAAEKLNETLRHFEENLRKSSGLNIAKFRQMEIDQHNLIIAVDKEKQRFINTMIRNQDALHLMAHNQEKLKKRDKDVVDVHKHLNAQDEKAVAERNRIKLMQKNVKDAQYENHELENSTILMENKLLMVDMEKCTNQVRFLRDDKRVLVRHLASLKHKEHKLHQEMERIRESVNVASRSRRHSESNINNDDATRKSFHHSRSSPEISQLTINEQPERKCLGMWAPKDAEDIIPHIKTSRLYCYNNSKQ